MDSQDVINIGIAITFAGLFVNVGIQMAMLRRLSEDFKNHRNRHCEDHGEQSDDERGEVDPE